MTVRKEALPIPGNVVPIHSSLKNLFLKLVAPKASQPVGVRVSFVPSGTTGLLKVCPTVLAGGTEAEEPGKCGIPISEVFFTKFRAFSMLTFV